jgi:hypothetical protein
LINLNILKGLRLQTEREESTEEWEKEPKMEKNGKRDENKRNMAANGE